MADEEKQEETTEEETQTEEATEQEAESTEDASAGDDTQSSDDTADAKASDDTAGDDAADASGDESSSDEEGEDTVNAEDGDGADVEIPEKFQGIVSEIENMSVLDLNELVKLLEKKFGVSAVAAAAPAAGGGDAAGEEEKSSFTVELTDVGDQKIGVIKAVKNALGLGLKEAKDMAENLPATLKEDMPKEDAEQLKSDIEEAGGSVELK